MGWLKRRIIEELEPTMAEWNRRWIPVTERTPDDSNSVLLYLDHRDGYGGAAVGYYIGGQFWLYEGDNITCDAAGVDATHWMPLPAPPTDDK